MSAAMMSAPTALHSRLHAARCSRAPASLRATLLARPALAQRRSHIVRAVNEQATEQPQQQKDSYEKIEEPVRQGIPDGGPAISERKGALDNAFSPPPANSGVQVDFFDAMRFKGAAPEIINGRLAMLGIIAALGAELSTGTNVFDQFKTAPVAIVATFALFVTASFFPILKGVPRSGKGFWNSNAELLNGRVAMLGFLSLVIATLTTGGGLPFLKL